MLKCEKEPESDMTRETHRVDPGRSPGQGRLKRVAASTMMPALKLGACADGPFRFDVLAPTTHVFSRSSMTIGTRALYEQHLTLLER